jgi:hypothetical protein
MPNQRHKWSLEDDIVALFLYRFGDQDLPLSAGDIGEKLGMGRGSLVMRIANFRSLDGGNGLRNWSEQSETIYHTHKGSPKEELRALVLRILT